MNVRVCVCVCLHVHACTEVGVTSSPNLMIREIPRQRTLEEKAPTRRRTHVQKSLDCYFVKDTCSVEVSFFICSLTGPLKVSGSTSTPFLRIRIFPSCASSLAISRVRHMNSLQLGRRSDSRGTSEGQHVFFSPLFRQRASTAARILVSISTCSFPLLEGLSGESRALLSFASRSLPPRRRLSSSFPSLVPPSSVRASSV